MNKNEDHKCRIKKPHLSKMVFILPCENKACQNCISKFTDQFKAFSCPYCKKRHKTSELTQSSNEKFSKNDITDLLKSFKKSSFDLKKRLLDEFRPFKNLFEFIEENMQIRLDSLQIELDKQNYMLDESIDRIKCQISDKLYFIQSKSSELNSIKSDCNLKRLIGIERDLNKAAININTHSKKLESFKISSKNFPKDKQFLIGKLYGPIKQIDLSNFINSELDLIDLSDYLSNLTSLCQTKDGRILILDNFMNSVIFFDKYFKFLNIVFINDIAGIKEAKLAFNSNLYSISSSDNYIHINNMERNEILIFDKNMDILKTIFSPIAKTTLDSKFNSFEFEIEFYENHLYVLSNPTRVLFKYSELGKLVNEIKLEDYNLDKFAEHVLKKIDKHLITVPKSFAINDNNIACVLPVLSEIHIYGLDDGKLNIVIEANFFDKFSDICLLFERDCIVSYCKYNGSVLVYKSNKDENHKLEYNLAVEKRFPKLRSKIGVYFYSNKSIFLIDNQIAIVISDQNLIGLINC